MGHIRRVICTMIPHPDPNRDVVIPKTSLYPTIAQSIKPGPADPRTGKPTWAVVFLNAPDLTAILADPDIYPVPELGLDLQLSSLPWALRQAFWAKLEAITGLTRGDFKLTDNNTCRELINTVVRRENPGFDLDGWWIDQR